MVKVRPQNSAEILLMGPNSAPEFKYVPWLARKKSPCRFANQFERKLKMHFW